MSNIENVDHYDGDACMILIEGFGLSTGFCLGNALKYLWRCGKKDLSKSTEDIKKAQWYFRRVAQRLEVKCGEHDNAIKHIHSILVDMPGKLKGLGLITPPAFLAAVDDMRDDVVIHLSMRSAKLESERLWDLYKGDA